MTQPILPADAKLSKGVAVCVLSALCYSGSAVFVRSAYQSGLSPGTAIFLRFAIAFLALATYLTVSRSWVGLSLQQVWPLFLLGLCGYTVIGVTYFQALSLTPAWLVALCIALYPLPISVGSWLFFGEPVTRQTMVALLAVLIGGVVLFWQPLESLPLAGIGLMLVNVLAYALYILIGQRWTLPVAPAVATLWIASGAAVGTFVYALVTEQLAFDFEPAGWLWALLFGVVSTALAILLFWWGVGLVGPSRASIVGALETPLAILAAVIFLQERMTAPQLVGTAVILAGVLLVRLQPGKARRGVQ